MDMPTRKDAIRDMNHSPTVVVGVSSTIRYTTPVSRRGLLVYVFTSHKQWQSIGWATTHHASTSLAQAGANYEMLLAWYRQALTPVLVARLDRYLYSRAAPDWRRVEE